MIISSSSYTTLQAWIRILITYWLIKPQSLKSFEAHIFFSKKCIFQDWPFLVAASWAQHRMTKSKLAAVVTRAILELNASRRVGVSNVQRSSPQLEVSRLTYQHRGWQIGAAGPSVVFPAHATEHHWHWVSCEALWAPTHSQAALGGRTRSKPAKHHTPPPYTTPLLLPQFHCVELFFVKI